MRNLPIHWSEGLFLKPHHFQAADRAWSEVLQTGEQWDHPYHYGIRRLELSPEAIANYQFQAMQATDAWPPLGRDIVLAIYDVIGKAIEVLSEQVVSRRLSMASTEPGDLDRVLMLAQLNACYGTLGVLAFAAGVPPFALFAVRRQTAGVGT